MTIHQVTVATTLPGIERAIASARSKEINREYREALRTVARTEELADGTTVEHYAEAGRPPLLPHPSGGSPRKAHAYRRDAVHGKILAVTRDDMTFDTRPEHVRKAPVKTYTVEQVRAARAALDAQRRERADAAQLDNEERLALARLGY